MFGLPMSFVVPPLPKQKVVRSSQKERGLYIVEASFLEVSSVLTMESELDPSHCIDNKEYPYIVEFEKVFEEGEVQVEGYEKHFPPDFADAHEGSDIGVEKEERRGNRKSKAMQITKARLKTMFSLQRRKRDIQNQSMLGPDSTFSKSKR